MKPGSALRLLLPVLAASTWFGSGALAASPKLYFQETRNVKVFFYDPAHEYLVEHLIRCFETALEGERARFQYAPKEQVSILLEDFADFGHGSAGTMPKAFSNISLEPVNYTFETLPANERIQWIVNHELVHVITGDVSSGRERVLRRLFGGKTAVTAEDPVSIAYSAMSTPRAYAPRWYQEGIASFMETWLGGGMGRALGGYDEMTFRAMVRDEAYMYSIVGLESEGTAVDFQVMANAYLYGTRFMTHVVRQYGPDKLMEWMGRREGSKPYFTTPGRPPT
jgi:hypothetical protein